MANSRAAHILDRMLDPVTNAFTPEGARSLLALRADAAEQERIDYLADKCNEGALTAEERAEYEAYVSADTLLSILQAKARRFLNRRAS